MVLAAIDYLLAENRVLRERLGPKRLRFTDAERQTLAQKGKPVGRKLLEEMATRWRSPWRLGGVSIWRLSGLFRGKNQEGAGLHERLHGSPSPASMS
jgi:hypothetical protein